MISKPEVFALPETGSFCVALTRRKFFLLFVSQAAIRCVGRRTFGVSLWSGDVGRHREAGTPNTKAPSGYKLENPLALAMGSCQADGLGKHE